MTPRPRFFGLHFDLHASANDTELGARVNDALVERIIRLARPDFLQYDCKGHNGCLAYPRSKVSQSAGAEGGKGMIRDSLAVYRRVTKRHGVPLFMHFSGIWDDAALRDHPEWATMDEHGQPRASATSTFGPYVTERMIPQMLEIMERYRPDGFWVDGDGWAAWPDYTDEARRLFREATGLETPPVQPGDPGWLAWMRIHRDRFLAYARTYMDALHARYPGVRLASNWFHTRFSPEPRGAIPADFISGDYSQYCSVDTARFDARQMASVGLPWDLMSWGSLSVPGSGQAQKPAVQVQQEAATVLALGGGFQVYYIPDRDGAFAETQLLTMREVSRFCRARRRSCFQSEPVPQVGVLLDTTSFWSVSPSVYACYGGEYRPMQGLLQAVLDAGHCADVLADHQLDEQADRFPVIAVPEWEHLPEAVVEKLAAYAARGGSLLLTGARTVALFRKHLDGLELTGEPAQASATLHAKPSRAGAVPPHAPASGVWQSFRVKPGAAGRFRVVAWRTVKKHEARDPEPAAAIGRLGRGRVACVPGPLGATHYQAQNRTNAVETVQKLMQDVGPVDAETVWRFSLTVWPKSSVHLGDWSAVGPFPVPAGSEVSWFDAVFPPERDGLRLKPAYELVPGSPNQATWTENQAPSYRVNVRNMLREVREFPDGAAGYSRAYAVSEADQPAMLEIAGCDGPAKVWFNGRQVANLPNGGTAIAEVRVRRGANVTLVKTGAGGFLVLTLHPIGPTPLRGIASVKAAAADNE